jgi:hypothetical protein
MDSNSRAAKMAPTRSRWPSGVHELGSDTNTEPVSRAVAYHCTDYILRYMLDMGSIFEFDYERMAICLVIANSNIQNIINVPEKFAPYTSVDVIIPAEMQRPVTRSAIARATGLPRETVRRKVAAMLDVGLLTTDTRGGLRLTPGILSTPRIADILARNQTNVRRLVRQVSTLL